MFTEMRRAQTVFAASGKSLSPNRQRSLMTYLQSTKTCLAKRKLKPRFWRNSSAWMRFAFSLLGRPEIKYCDSSRGSNQRACKSAQLRETTTLRTISPRFIQAPTRGAMWLRRAALAHSRARPTSLSRFSQYSRCVVNSMTRCATPVRYASSDSSRPQLDSASARPVIDLEPARRVLRETFGHETFRPGQEEVISRLLSGESMVLSWPFKSGSSICYLVRQALSFYVS